MNPVFVAYRKFISKLFFQKFCEINPIGTVSDAFPKFQHFFYMLMDLVTSCTTIVNDAFSEYAIDGYKSGGFDYLLKPLIVFKDGKLV